MKNFWTVFLAIILGGGIVAAGFFFMQRRALQNDRRTFVSAVQAAEARDAYTKWIIEADAQAEKIRWGARAADVAAFCEAYKNALGWTIRLPDSDRSKYEADLAELQKRVLGYLPKGSPYIEDVAKANRR